MKRVFDPHEPELMDRPQPVTAELQRDLENLASLNRYFGSHRLMRRFLAAWLRRGRVYRILDLCTGFGDIPRVMVAWARPRGISVRIDAIDANPSTIEIARLHSARAPEIRYECADVLAFEAGERYDLVCCSLALHHFSEDDAVRLLRRCRELSHRFALVADLERSPATALGVWALTQFIYRDPMTRHDGRVSARRAFSFREMRMLAEAAEWEDFGHARFAFCRQAIWLDRREVIGVRELAASVAEPLPTPA
jgi:2-polyprenyl-3-methyl-5-hydroxy-6-metoxy-1,4-benzoquinol methylase